MIGAVASIAAACLAAGAVGCGSEASDGPRAEVAGSGKVRLVAVGRFSSPLYLTAPRGDRSRVFVVEQGGRIRLVKGGKVRKAPFLDVSSQLVSGGEQGLLGLAFAPDYAQSRRFYVHYSAKGSGDTRIVEYRARSNGDSADPGTARVVLTQDQPESNHNGGQLAFGPDGLLYIGLGDGGGGNDQHGERGNAQNRGTLLGKILRIDPRASDGKAYSIPADNPFAGQGGARGEIYSYGLRNPWRFSFDRSTGALAIGDVGQNAVEEIDWVAKGRGRGANFGWRPFEGTKRIFPGEDAPGHIKPLIQKQHSDGWCSITGGYVVRDPGLSALRGRYLYGDFCEGKIRAARLGSRGASGDRDLGLRKIADLSSFGEDARGRIYVVSLSGPVYRLTQG
jgi:glucose/arabinose dehydrogenase